MLDLDVILYYNNACQVFLKQVYQVSIKLV